MADTATGIRGNLVAWSSGPYDPVDDDIVVEMTHCVSALEVISWILFA